MLCHVSKNASKDKDLEIMHPVDDVEEGEGEREEDPGEAVDLRGRVERSAGQHCRFLPLFPEKVKVFDLDPSKYRYIEHGRGFQMCKDHLYVSLAKRQ